MHEHLVFFLQEVGSVDHLHELLASYLPLFSELTTDKRTGIRLFDYVDYKLRAMTESDAKSEFYSNLDNKLAGIYRKQDHLLVMVFYRKPVIIHERHWSL